MSPVGTAAHKPSHNLAESNIWSLSTPTSCPKNSQLWCYIRLLRNSPRQVLKISTEKYFPNSLDTWSGAKPLSRWRIFSLRVIRFLLLQLMFIAFGVHLLFPSVCPQKEKNRNKIPPRAFLSQNWATLCPSVFPPYAVCSKPLTGLVELHWTCSCFPTFLFTWRAPNQTLQCSS